ncbi:hypothetical protein AAFA46_07730 [Oscillospiraceae bacterium WX1]
MNTSEQHITVLRTLMAEALDISRTLKAYTDEHYDVFLSGDDEKIVAVVNDREKIIEKLVSIEYQIDDLFENVDAFENGRALPPDAEALRRAARAVLRDVSKKDLDIMKIIGGKMKIYKNETLKARNKKNISAYMKTVLSEQPGDSVDLSK